eukprot:4317583-Ditylum_brightwellii.AAC.1
MHQHSIQAQQFQQALLHMQTTQNQMLTQLTVGTTTTAAALHNLLRGKLKPTLVVTPWTQSTKKEWLAIVTHRIAQCPYFLVLFDAPSNQLTMALAQAHEPEDSDLSHRILK